MLRTRTAARLARLAVAALAALALLGVSAASAKAPASAAGAKSKPKLVTVNDFFFGPSSVRIKKGGSVRWVWSSTNTAPHDVHLKSGPKGLKKKGTYSTKTTAVTDAEFKKAFPTAGTYKFVCTIHPTEMKLTVVVKK
ncbi:MAG TPA: plastocyanin/azurin family copper-binding protein [Solirubrobacterales bacterium]|nr:plastocyanin/azurin family copper-binding protein [Solirubrobacterales bacterium]